VPDRQLSRRRRSDPQLRHIVYDVLEENLPLHGSADPRAKLIVSGKLAHGGNPVTRWMAANVAVAQDPAGNLKPAKDKSTERIDGIVATIMAIGRALVAQEEPQPEYSLHFV
jgi:phage terminase large subunit-like protein